MKKVKKRLYRELLLWELMAFDIGQNAAPLEGRFEYYKKQMDAVKLEKDLDFKASPVFYDFKSLVKSIKEKSDEEILEEKNRLTEDLSFTRELKRQINWTLQRGVSDDDKPDLEREQARLAKEEYMLLQEREQYKKNKKNQATVVEDEDEDEDDGISVVQLCFDDVKDEEDFKNAWQDPAFWNQIQSSFEQIIRFMSALDILIQFRALNWKINRMSVIDRNILRIAVFELYFQSDIPTKVVINEAIDVSKKYGTQESRKFINAILDKVALDLGRKK